jgi:hypothetical protein
LALGLVLALWAWPPALIRIGAAYAAKIVCSNVFLAGRDPGEVLRTDVQAPGHPLLHLMRVAVDRDRGVVHAGLFGFVSDGPGCGRSSWSATVGGSPSATLRASARSA